jgi:hypothetical protein
MNNANKDKFYSEKNGMLIGFAVPAVIIFGNYLYIQPDNFLVFIKTTLNFSIYNRFVGFAIIPNFLLYFYFRWKSKFKFAEGFSIASLIYLILIIMLKYAS